jgi:hypothetical protein
VGLQLLEKVAEAATFYVKRRFHGCCECRETGSMPTSEDYKRSAAECRRLAEVALDEVERNALLRMARQWDRLAAYKARVESDSDKLGRGL